MVLDFSFPVFSEEVKAEGIFFGLVESEKFGAERCPLGWVDVAFEDGVLYALAIVEAGFCDTGKAAASGFVDGGYVVGDED